MNRKYCRRSIELVDYGITPEYFIEKIYMQALVLDCKIKRIDGMGNEYWFPEEEFNRIANLYGQVR